MKFISSKTIGKTASDNALQLKQAIDLVWKSAPGWTLAGIALIILQGSLPLAALYLMKLIVDAVTSGASLESVLVWIGLAGAVALLVAICNSASNVVSEAQSILVSDSIQEILHAKSVEVDLEYSRTPNTTRCCTGPNRRGPAGRPKS